MMVEIQQKLTIIIECMMVVVQQNKHLSEELKQGLYRRTSH